MNPHPVADATRPLPSRERRGGQAGPPPSENIQESRDAPLVGREDFAKISEMEGIRLTEDGKAMFAEFDRHNLSAEERRQAIIKRFRQEAAE